jgi:hypothetical protein
VLVLATVGVLLAGGGVAFVVYDQATAIDRSTPDVVVVQFLQAALVEKDPNRVSLFVCDQWAPQAAIAAAGAPSNPKIVSSWGDLRSSTTGDNATVQAKLTFSLATNGGFQQDVQSWTFELRNQSGWRVCSLSKS